MTDRRAFLKMLGLTSAGLAVGGTSYFFAPVGGWAVPIDAVAANQLLLNYYSDLIRDKLNSSIPFHSFMPRGSLKSHLGLLYGKDIKNPNRMKGMSFAKELRDMQEQWERDHGPVWIVSRRQ